MGILEKLLGQSEAGAGRGKVNPKTVEEMMDEKRSPAEREARQMMKERAAAKADEDSYNKAMPKPYAKGGKVSSASKRADGCATKGKTRGKFV